MKHLFSLIFFVSMGWVAAHAQTAPLTGMVTDKQTGEPLPGASVEVSIKGGVKLHFLTGLNGGFVVRNLKAGHYEVEVKYVGFDKYEKEMDLGDGKPQTVTVSLEPKKSELATVSVSAGARGTERSSQLADRRADIVQNSLSARAIEVSPDLSVANTAQRISGVTLERSSNGEGQYIIVRGMEKRYIYTLVNGIKIPSPDNKNRYVPLDIFPADLLERLEITKTLTPNMEGDAIGGAVNMVMKDAPSKFSVNASAAAGYGSKFAHDDFSKFDNGPSLDKSPRVLNGQGYSATPGDFPNSAFNHSLSHNPIDQVFGLSLGGRTLGDKLGVMVAGSFQNNYRNVSSTLFQLPDQLVDGGYQLASVDKRNLSVQQQRSGAHVKLDYRLDSKNKLSLYGGYVNLMRNEFRQVSDTNLELARTVPGLGRITNSYRTLHETQQILNFTLKGEHTLAPNLFLDWTGAYSKAILNRPDEATFSVNGSVLKDPVTSQPTPEVTNIQSASREFVHSSDEDKSGYANFTYKSQISGALVDWSLGGMYRDKHRVSSYDKYSLTPTGDVVYRGTMNGHTFTVGNPDGTVQDPLNYTANEKVGAGYGMVKISVGSWLVTGGARYEHTSLDWLSSVPETKEGKTGNISYYDVLPSGNIKYSFDRKMALRLSYYSAISRPNFFEVIPYILYNPETGLTETGNPHLKRTTADNFDLRYEYYPKGLDQLIVGVFYKRLKNPIEYTITNKPDPQSDAPPSNNTYFVPQNFGNATNYGAELDLTKYWRWLGVRLNYTFTQSSITTTKEHDYRVAGATTAEYINQTRPLQGQSKHVGNFSLLFKDDNKLGLNAQLAFGYTSARINTVSGYYNYDIWQKAFTQLDFSLEKRIVKRFYIYGKINNLLNTPYELEVHQPYKSPTAVPPYYPPFQTEGKNLFMRKDTYGVNYLLGIKFKL
ncbi:MAG: TonB-dependent receptor [Bacteroidetes bacterium]|nr:TonB-dependent receptor [Bacteroidota bacterium]